MTSPKHKWSMDFTSWDNCLWTYIVHLLEEYSTIIVEKGHKSQICENSISLQTSFHINANQFWDLKVW
jgi:hypothetical protein